MGWFLSKEKDATPTETLIMQLLLRRNYPFDSTAEEMDFDQGDIDWIVSIVLTLHLNDHYHFFGKMFMNDSEQAVQKVGRIIVRMNRAYANARGFWGRECINRFANMYILEFSKDYERTALAASALNVFRTMWDRALIQLQYKLERNRQKMNSEFFDCLHRALHPNSDV